MGENIKKYSIILPVFNGGAYFKLCVKSILSQSLNDFNLIIPDSGSTDGSIEWAEGLADSRIKIYRTEKKLTIEENWGRIKDFPRNEFMTIIGHDDLFDTDYLQKLNELINRFPGAGLYQSHFRFIDSFGGVIRKCRPMDEKIFPADLLRHFLNSSIDTMGTGFMMRSRDFDAAGGMPVYPKLLFADMELWQRLTANSFLAVEKSELFSYRRHPEATTAATDIKTIIRALEMFIDFIKKEAENRSEYMEVLKSSVNNFLRQYCQGLSHKLLRTPVAQRNNLTVAEVIHEFRRIGGKLNAPASFEPLDYFKIRAGKIIDSNSFLRSIYILAKFIQKAFLISSVFPVLPLKPFFANF